MTDIMESKLLPLTTALASDVSKDKRVFRWCLYMLVRLFSHLTQSILVQCRNGDD